MFGAASGLKNLQSDRWHHERDPKKAQKVAITVERAALGFCVFSSTAGNSVASSEKLSQQ